MTVGTTNGTGRAGWFWINNVSSSASAIYGNTNGTGPLFLGNTTGTGNLLQLQQGGVDKFVVDNSGAITTASGVVLTSPSAGQTIKPTSSVTPLIIRPFADTPTTTIFAVSSSTGGSYFKVTSDGTVTVSGNLSKPAGSFLIDHPLNPQNKVLRHSFVESPDMKNVYDGIAVLDEKGEAIVELPEYFQTLNIQFRYQLTPVGGYAPLYIKQEIRENRFVVASANEDKDAGLKVSWQITGIRNDPYAQINPIVVEEEKGTGTASAYKKGEYIYKDAYDAYFAKQKEKEQKKLAQEK